MADQNTITTIIWIVFAGICFGAFYAYYHRRLVGDIIRAIIRNEATDASSAVTLDDIGYGSGIKKRFARFVLKKGSAARKFVETVYEELAPVKKNEDELFVKAPKTSEEQKYFISKDRRVSAEVKYYGEGTSIATVLITVGVFFAAALISVSVLPWILSNIGKLSGQTDELQPNTPEYGISQNDNISEQNEAETVAETEQKEGIAILSPDAQSADETKLVPAN